MGKLRLLPVCGVLLAACGGHEVDPPGVPVNLVLVDSTEAEPAMVGDRCVVFAPKITDAEACTYQVGRTPGVFAGIGRSILECMQGRAQPYISEVPAHFYDHRLFINTDGQCQPGASGCYFPDNPTVDRAQTHWSTDPSTALWQLEALIGHETWHAVAGNFDTVGQGICALPSRTDPGDCSNLLGCDLPVIP